MNEVQPLSSERFHTIASSVRSFSKAATKNKILSINQKIFRAAVTVAFLTTVVKIAAMVKELVVARSFGRGDALDAFLIAFLLPAFMVNLVSGSLGAAFIPTFVETCENEGVEAAQKLFSSMMFLILVVLATIALLVGLCAPYCIPYLASGFSVEKLHATLRFLYVLLPFVVFSGITTYVSAVLNAGEKFVLAAVTPVLTPLLIILLLTVTPVAWGGFSLALGTTAGSFLEALVLACALRAKGTKLTPSWSGLDRKVRIVLQQYLPMLAGALLMGGTTVVDQSMAAMLSAGNVAALGYANKIISAISGIGAMALGTAALPYFSKMVASNDWNGCRDSLKRNLRIVALLAVPLTVTIVVFSQPLIRVLFQRGLFTSDDTRLVSWVLVCYSIQIPFFMCGLLCVRFLSSIKRNDVLMYGAGVSLILDVVLNILLMKVWGVAGIALSTSLVYIFAFIYLSAFSFRLLSNDSRICSRVNS